MFDTFLLNTIFMQILNMSFTASIVISVVLIIRLFLRKAPKFFSNALWGVVLFRLICPFSFESFYSLLPMNKTPISPDIIYMQEPKIDSGITVIDRVVNPILPEATVSMSVNPIQIYIAIALRIWVIGMAALFLCSFISLLKLVRQLRGAVFYQDNIYLSDNINTAFVIGILHPKIYVPTNLGTEEREYILLHEKTHIRRMDHFIKFLGFLALCVHWFNPLVWVASYLSSKDMEMACDEAVIKQLGNEIKKEYSLTLLTLASGRRITCGRPIAFGEGDTKSRIKHVLNYKKPAFRWICVSFLIAAAAGSGLLSNKKSSPPPLPQSSEVTVISMKQMNGGDIGEPSSFRKQMELDEVEISQKVDIENILGVMQNSNKIFKNSRNDIPEMNILFQMNLKESHTRTFYIYHNNRLSSDTYYIEEPYSGIFKISREDVASIIKIYKKNGGVGVYSDYDITALWNARTQYVGDNSAVGKLIYLLPTPFGFQYDHFELSTNKKPYKIEIIYSVNEETLLQYDNNKKETINPLSKNALLLLALINNADEIQTTLTDGKREITFINGREWADEAASSDVRKYTESPEKLWQLIRRTNNL